MKIGIIGAGHIGFGMGSLWAEKGHEIGFSYSRSPAKLKAAVAAAGGHACFCTPVEAAQFGQVVLLAIHWPQVPQVVCELRPYMAGKPLLTCVIPWNQEHTGLCIGRNHSAAEEIARLAPEAHVVEALPLLADGLYAPSRLFAQERATLFYCGNEASAKEVAAFLLEELDMQTMDAGNLTSARLLEPTAALLWELAIGMGVGTEIALKLLMR